MNEEDQVKNNDKLHLICYVLDADFILTLNQNAHILVGAHDPEAEL